MFSRYALNNIHVAAIVFSRYALNNIHVAAWMYLCSPPPLYISIPPSAPAADQVLSPPQHDDINEADITSPPASRRRVMSSSPGAPLFSSPPPQEPSSEIDLSSPLNFDTPASRVGAAATPKGTPRRFRSDLGSGAHRPREVNLAPTDPPVSTPA